MSDTFFTLEGTVLPDLDELIEAVVHEQSLMTEEDGVEHVLFPSFHKRYICPLQNLITARQKVVEQDDVQAGRTDMQGFCWREGELGKKAYRNFMDSIQSTAHLYYKGATALEENREVLDYDGHEFYRFRFTNTDIHCSHHHPQLRNLVCATSKNDVYYLYNNAIEHWCPQLQTSKTILGQPLMTSRARVPNRITTMAAMNQFLLVGGEDGSFTFMNLQNYEDPIFDSFTNGEYMEVNSIEMSYSRTGAPHAYVSTNDFQVKRIDLTTLETTATFPTEWFVNYTSQSPDRHMIAVVGDDLEGQVMSTNSQEKIASLKGHQRHSFSAAWSPDSMMLATGSDDRSTCIYDSRMMLNPVHILSTDIMDSVRSLRYSPCGRYLVMAEDRNFVHIVDTTVDYSKAQKIDFVGDISGISLTPDGESLFVGMSSCVDFSSILEFERLRPNCETFCTF